MDRFYVYLFLRTDGTPYYVGKGTGDRQFKRRRHERAKLPTDPTRNVRILDGMSEEDAHAWEMLLIARWGRKDIGTGILYNRTDGGEGVSGHRHSEETRTLLSLRSHQRFEDPAERAKLSHPGWNHTPEARERIGAGARGRVKSPEECAKISAAKKGKPRSPETIEKMRAAATGRTWTSEQREKFTATMTGRKASDQARENIRQSRIGKTHSAEAKASMSAAAKERAARPGESERRAAAAAAQATRRLAQLLDGSGITVDEYKAMPNSVQRKLSKALRQQKAADCSAAV